MILSGLRKVGALRSGQNLTAAELADCLQVLQDMLDAWNAERTMVYEVPYTTVDQNGATLTLKANQQKYLLGNINGTEDFLLPRPPRIQRISVLYSASQATPVEVPLDMYDDVQWQGISNKGTKSLLPQVCYLEYTADGTDYTLYFWPIPTQANPIVLYPWQQLNQFPNLQAKFFFPPAYSKAITFNLAVDLFSEFSGDDKKLPIVVQQAARAKEVIERFNAVINEATCDPAILGAGGRMGNIFTGTSGRQG